MNEDLPLPPAEEIGKINAAIETSADDKAILDSFSENENPFIGESDYTQKQIELLELKKKEAERQREEEVKQRERAEKLATKDRLTGIDNLLGFEEELRKMASRVPPSESSHKRKSELRSIAVMFADIDHFKKINDAYGHDVGDAVLKAVASQLKGLMRTEDIVARYGGEEFVLVFEDANQEEILKKFGSKLPTVEITLPNGKSITVTMSAGVAEYQSGVDIETGIRNVIKRADTAMYQAKNNGRNQIVAAEA